jgi:predicted TIM-barrel fold metal-dependent hydrolase
MMATQLNEWLKLTREDPIDPDLPICDPHHHLWDHPDYLPEDRVPDTHRQLRHYMLKELLEDTGGGHRIEQTVFMECRSMYRKDGPQEMRPVGQTEFVQGIAAQSASGQYGDTAVAAGIVGFADLTLGSEVAPVLEAHIAASRNRFRGTRFTSTWDASNEISSRVKTPKMLSDSKFREGFACLHKYNLSFDAWLYHPQLLDLADLANAFPDTPIILNHIGGPIGIGPYARKREEVFQEWKQGIVSLSTCPNVALKLGGFGMPLLGFGWHERPKPPNSAELAEAIAPYIHWCVDRFGPDRCMFESNFPVDKASYSYTVVWNAFKRFSRDYSQRDQIALFHDTAAKTYRLTPKKDS